MPKKFGLFILIAGLTIMKLALVTKGHFHMQDELRYRYTFAFIREIVNLNFLEAGRQLWQFNLYARPGLVLFNLPPALLQVIFLLLTGIKTETPISLTIPSVIQALASVAIGWLVYRLGKRYLKSEVLAISGLIIYSLLVNANLYIRHIGPYDTLLLIHLFWLDLVLIRYRKWSLGRWVVICGLVAGALYLVYPAYYLFVPVVGTLVSFLPGRGWWKRGVIFVVTFSGVILVTEMAARLMGGSYLADARFAAGRLVVGDPKETLIFLYRYLWQVEGWIGKLLVISLSGFLVQFMLKWRKYDREFRWLTLAMVGSYLAHSLSGFLAGKVFYGRLMHMFMWFAVLGGLMWLKQINLDLKIKYLLVAIIVGSSLVSFVGWYPTFLRLNYPGDVIYQLAKNNQQVTISAVDENYPPESPEHHPRENAEYLAINFGRTFFPEAKIYEYDTGGGELIFQAAHPINFKAYQFEGLTPQERELIQERDYQMKLYRL